MTTKNAGGEFRYKNTKNNEEARPALGFISESLWAVASHFFGSL